MASKRRRRGRPRKTGHRYPSGDLKAKHETAISPASVAATQPHRKGLGEQAADQLAESVLGRLCLSGHLSKLQHLAGITYGRQWRTYLATLDGPRWTGKGGTGRVNPCEGCDGAQAPLKCACGLAARLWRRSWDAMERVDAAALVTDLVAYEVPVLRRDLPLLRAGLDELVFELGLSNSRRLTSSGKSVGKLMIHNNVTD
jgi:hypothetical protein